ncbi:MAG: DUF5058 family protein [Spirochaetales bacterium]|nr:DUF5058 family protein [Spirochaetales bacterium]
MINPNSGLLFALAAIVIVFVFIQSIFFIAKAWKQAKKIGMKTATLKKTVISSAIFTVIPSISIAMGILVLSKALGLAVPWMRLSVIGSLAYETTVAASAVSGYGYSMADTITNPKVFTSILWAMSIGTLAAFVVVPVFGKKIEHGMAKMKNKNSHWGELFGAALFIGMIATFFGAQFSGIQNGLVGWIPVFVMIVSALIMILCNTISKHLKSDVMENYSLPISMIGAMVSSIPITKIVMAILA